MDIKPWMWKMPGISGKKRKEKIYIPCNKNRPRA
jgi:hypothetical protein